MKQFMLLLFVLLSLLHLYGTWKDDRKLRARTKCLLVPALLGYYVCSVTALAGIVLIMLICCWIGDLLLMRRGVKWFVAGGIGFGVAHGCLIALFVSNIDTEFVVWWLTGMLGIGFCLVIVWVGKRLKRYLPKTVLCMMLFYLSLNALMNLFAVMQFMSISCKATLLQVVGALLFFISDSILFLVRFDKKSRLYKKHFSVMLTYIMAKFFLIQGIIMLMSF